MNTIEMFTEGSKWTTSVPLKAYGRLEVNSVAGNVITFIDEQNEVFQMSLAKANEYGLKRI